MRLSQLAAVLCVAFGATVALQWLGNGYRAEWTSSADEPAHYVTGLMVRDYLAQGLPGGPLAYAQRYYDHYPKVGFGHWPPVFYFVQAGWTLLFGVSRPSLIALMAVIQTLGGSETLFPIESRLDDVAEESRLMSNSSQLQSGSLNAPPDSRTGPSEHPFGRNRDLPRSGLVSVIRPAEPTRRPEPSNRVNADGILKFGQSARLKNSNRRWMLCRSVFQTTFWRAVLNMFRPGPVKV